MKLLEAFLLFAFLALPALVQARAPEPDTRVRVVDQFGNTRYDLPSLRVDREGRTRVVDRNGNTRYDLPSVRSDRDGRVRVVDPFGNTRYDLPSVRTQKPRS